MSSTILWHDYETWGVNPSVDFPVQFAAVRTDTNLNILETHKPINWMCAIAHDYLPHPQACLVTGITPSLSLRKGMSEPQFAEKIFAEMSQAQTCVAGYNSMRFDEEVTRNLLYRNFFPVYEREYKDNNSRWDVIDLVRAAYALRPQGLEWPINENGKPSFKLETLSEANDIKHESAHDALSDVYATIAVAKLIKTKQPKLFDYYWKLRSKHEVDKLLSRFQQQMYVYVSAYIKPEQGCCTLVMPVCRHPNNPNAVICIDMNRSVDALLNLNEDDLRQLLFTKTESDDPRIQQDIDEKPVLFSIATNKCPFIAPLNTLSVDNATRLDIDLAKCQQHFLLLANEASIAPLCRNVYASKEERPIPQNIDECLYATDFPSNADKQLMERVRTAAPEQLVAFQNAFEDQFSNARLFRYRGRNYPMTLEENEMSKWQQYLHMRFTQNNKLGCLSLQEYFLQIESLMTRYINVPEKIEILRALERHGQLIANS